MLSVDQAYTGIVFKQPLSSCLFIGVPSGRRNERNAEREPGGQESDGRQSQETNKSHE